MTYKKTQVILTQNGNIWKAVEMMEIRLLTVLVLAGLALTDAANSTTVQDKDGTCRNAVYHVQNLSQSGCCQEKAETGKALEDLKSQVASLQAEVQTLKAGVKMKGPLVGFHVGLSKVQTTVPATVEFDVVINHYGNCWNAATHTFVAPVTGLYSFTLTIMNPSSSRIALAQIMHESKILQRAYSTAGNDYNVGTAAVVVKVTKGEHVLVRLTHGPLHSNGDYWSNFVGFLIAEE